MPIVAGQGLDYNVDIVMCIDATGSMSPIIEEVKTNALSFYKKFVAEMDEANKRVEQLRIKVIVFRDYECDTELVGHRFGIARAMAAEIMYMNDEYAVDEYKWVEVEFCGEPSMIRSR